MKSYLYHIRSDDKNDNVWGARLTSAGDIQSKRKLLLAKGLPSAFVPPRIHNGDSESYVEFRRVCILQAPLGHDREHDIE